MSISFADPYTSCSTILQMGLSWFSLISWSINPTRNLFLLFSAISTLIIACFLLIVTFSTSSTELSEFSKTAVIFYLLDKMSTTMSCMLRKTTTLTYMFCAATIFSIFSSITWIGISIIYDATISFSKLSTILSPHTTISLKLSLSTNTFLNICLMFTMVNAPLSTSLSRTLSATCWTFIPSTS